MALLTQKAIMATFQEMLEEMPFDKITVSALVKRGGISSNTFYYHYQDKYALLDAWLNLKLDKMRTELGETNDWRSESKKLLHLCQDHPNIVYHIYESLSREQMERYVFFSSDDTFLKQIRLKTQGIGFSEQRTEELAQFCKYAYLGFFLKFLWNRMAGNVDENVDRLSSMFSHFVNGEISGVQKK